MHGRMKRQYDEPIYEERLKGVVFLLVQRIGG